MVYIAGLLVVVGGCGRIGFDRPRDADPAQEDAEIARDAQLVIDAPVLGLDAGQCPTAYLRAGASCYRLSLGEAETWLEAELACEADGVGAHLATIDDATEGSVLASIFTEPDYWVGFTDRVTEDTYRNVTGEAAPYLLWVEGEPTSSDCGQFDEDMRFHVSTCDTSDEYVCEFDGRAVAAGSY
jgi:hypothetical protein